jgi:hypothetical protein
MLITPNFNFFPSRMQKNTNRFRNRGDFPLKQSVNAVARILPNQGHEVIQELGYSSGVNFGGSFLKAVTLIMRVKV